MSDPVGSPGDRRDASSRAASSVKDNWAVPTAWMCAVIVLHILLSNTLKFAVTSDPAAREDLMRIMSASVYEKSAAAFFAIMCLNLVSFVFEDSGDKRLLAILLALVHGLSWLSDQQLLSGQAPVIFTQQGYIFLPCRWVQCLCTSPLLLYIVSKMSATAMPQAALTIAAEAAMLISSALMAMVPSPISVGLVFIASHCYTVWSMKKMADAVLKDTKDSDAIASLRFTMIAALSVRALMAVATVLPLFSYQLIQVAELLTVICNFASKFVFSTCIMYSNFADPEKRHAPASSAPSVSGAEAETLKKDVALLRETIRSKNQWIRIVGSELKTPLTAMIRLSTALARGSGGSLTDRGRGWIQTVIDGGSHVLGVVNDMLLVGAMETGTLSFKQEIVHLDKIVDQVLKCLSPLMSKEVVVEKAIASGLPPVVGDEARIRQVISNLVDNALKYTDRGKIQVRVRQDPQMNMVIIKVVDTGLGIPAKKLATIWGPDEPSHPGTASGLSFVKLLVDAHDGDVTVESVEGKGSAFIVRLPILQKNTRKSVEIVLRSACSKFGHHSGRLPSMTPEESDEWSFSRSRRTSTDRRSEDRRSSIGGFVTTLSVHEEDFIR